MVTIASMFRNKSPDKNRYVDRGEIRAAEQVQQLLMATNSSALGVTWRKEGKRERSLSRQAAPIACSVHRPFLGDTSLLALLFCCNKGNSNPRNY